MSFIKALFELNSLIYALTIGLSVGLTIWIYKKHNLSKYQLLIFVLLVLFWASINLIRAYRKVYALDPVASGGLGLDGIAAANIVAAYGLMSLFGRLPVFFLSDYFTSRKKVIGFTLLFIMLSSLSVYFRADYTTMFLSSLSLGLGASVLSLFNVMFSETFTKKQAIVSVSILSIAPLLAEFLVAPIQSILTQNLHKLYNIMWLVSGLIALVAFGFLMVVKDNKVQKRNFTFKKFKMVLFDSRFIMLSLFGIIVSFIRFASGQANMVAYANSELVQMNTILVAYLDVMFSIFQLVAGVIAGLYLKNKIGTKNTLYVGLLSVLIFALASATQTNPTLLFIVYGFNGFGYGILYNVLLGLAMQPFEVDMREISMGIYQTFFAIGIYYGDKIYALILQLIPHTFEGSQLYQMVFLLISGIVIVMLVLLALIFQNKYKEFIEA
ncbi:MAG: MFS transporter [Erysipelothrix sp.]|nr:MFS transporter [Erysipelothrix sp.]